MRQKSKYRSLAIASIAFVGLFVIPAVILLNLQSIIDRFTVLNFKPSVSIEHLSDRTQFTERGEFLFLASQPKLDGTQTFNDVCRHNKEYKISILGCYTDKKIYIYDIDDDRLDGIREVTAAHEMLHAAYDRLSSSEKERLYPLLDNAYSQHRNSDLEKRVKYYEENQPGQFYNELHSIVGTEFRDISKELEDYYSAYFEDRLLIVGLHEKYQGKLKGLQQSLERLSEEMSADRQLISQKSSEYQLAIDKLNQDISVFNSRARGGYYTSQSQFDRDRNGLLERSRQLSEQQLEISALINEYNQKVAEYNDYSALVNDLHESIDSTLAPPPSL